MDNSLYTLTGDIRMHVQFKEQLIYALEMSGELDLLERARKMALCGHKVDYALTENGDIVLANAQFCRQRLCPVCQWRRSLRTFSIMQDALERLGDDYVYILVTCSRPNCAADKVSVEVTELYHAWDRLVKLPEIKALCKGYFRALEVTYNPDRNDFHPHLHVMVAVRPSYFHSRAYVTHDRWVELWDEVNGWDATEKGHTLELHVNKLRSYNGVNSGLSEVCKYAVKPVSLYRKDGKTGTDEMIALAIMTHRQLHGRRLIRTYGCIADAVREARKCTSADALLNADDLAESVDAPLQVFSFAYVDGEYKFAPSSHSLDIISFVG